MASPPEIYNAGQNRQMAGDVEHLGEVVDLEGFRDVCIGLSDWITGYQAAYQNLTRNILIPWADWHTTVEAIVEGRDAVVVRQRAEATHLADFLGLPATGRRVNWEVVAIVKVKDGRVVENCTMLDLWGIYRQLTALLRHSKDYIMALSHLESQLFLVEHYLTSCRQILDTQQADARDVAKHSLEQEHMSPALQEASMALLSNSPGGSPSTSRSSRV